MHKEKRLAAILRGMNKWSFYGRNIYSFIDDYKMKSLAESILKELNESFFDVEALSKSIAKDLNTMRGKGGRKDNRDSNN